MSNIENQSTEFAINCKPATAAEPSQHAGKAQAKGHVRAMLHDVRSAHLAGKHHHNDYAARDHH